ncbi:MAG: DivIVA domain-containing protein [Acidimicrobiia bacterium]
MTTTGHPDIPAADFAMVRRGYDPEAVDAYLNRLREAVSEQLDQTARDAVAVEEELEEARRREEAIHLTFVAATKTKEEMVDAAERQLDEARAVAKEEADRILSEAQYEAFRVVTEAREEAEAALAEARHEAETLTAMAADEGVSLSSARAIELDRLREEFATARTERAAKLSRLRAATSDLEDRLRALAGGALEEVAVMRKAVRAESDALDDLTGSVRSMSQVTGDELDPDRRSAPAAEPVAVAPKQAERPTVARRQPFVEGAERPDAGFESTISSPAASAEDTNGETTTVPRGSFYSRRSARLPRIGADAANALAAVSAMRENMNVDPEHDESEDEDLAMQTA